MKVKRAMAVFAACAAMCAAAAPEVTWSVMHPTKLDPAYMEKVAAKAVEYGGVDSFEVCGMCHSGENGMDGLLLFEPYPNAAAACDRDRVVRTRAALKGVVAAAHKAGKKLYTPVIITNSDDYVNIEPVPAGEIKAGQKLITVS